MVAKLTEKAIAALECEPGQKDRLVFDDALPGLGVRVSQGGRKTFLAQYTVAGQKRRVPIGRWGAITLDQARQAARSILGDVAKGQDVAELRTAERRRVAEEAAAERMTLTVLLEQWAALALAQRRPSYQREAVRAVKVAFPSHLARPAASLRRVDTVQALDRLASSGRPHMAARTMAYGRACYAWAEKRGKVPGNPFSGIPTPTATVSRDRVLTDAEVGEIWRACGAMGWPFGPLTRLLLLTAQRREEVAGMAWAELSADGAVWTIPKERAKNGKANVVHLAPAARALLAELPRFLAEPSEGDKPALKAAELVFTTNRTTSVSGFSRAKAKLDETIEAARVKAAAEAGEDPAPAPPAWRLHDFRRTAVTWLAGNGVAPHVADKLLNHMQGTISGVAAVYQRGEFLAERKAALEAWSAHVLEVAEGGPVRDNVVQLWKRRTGVVHDR